METGIFYGVGVGPGDPELVTVKAARLLREADVIAAPDRGSGARTALEIAAPYIEETPVLSCPSPMIRDYEKLDGVYESTARRICACLEEGKTVVYPTLGDPTVYSTFIHIHRKVLGMGYRSEIVPGVTSFCAVAARLGESLCDRDQRLMLVPGGADVTDALQWKGSKVFMKSGSAILQLQDQLRSAGVLDRAMAVENCSMETERVYPHFGDMKEPGGYFCTVILKDE